MITRMCFNVIKCKILKFWHLKIVITVCTTSSDRIEMNLSSLDSSHQDESNGSGFMALSSIGHEHAFIKDLERFGVIELYINARDINLSPFNASQWDESNELN